MMLLFNIPKNQTMIMLGLHDIIFDNPVTLLCHYDTT